MHCKFTCYEVTSYTWNLLEITVFLFSYFQYLKTYGKSFSKTVPGIGHSVIRGLVTAGQWSAASSAVS